MRVRLFAFRRGNWFVFADPAPSVVREDRLVNHVRAIAHRRHGTRRVARPVTLAVRRGDGHHTTSGGLESSQLRRLVLRAFAGKQVGVRVARPGRSGVSTGPLELQQVGAVEEVIEIAGGEDQMFAE